MYLHFADEIKSGKFCSNWLRGFDSARHELNFSAYPLTWTFTVINTVLCCPASVMLIDVSNETVW